MKTNVLPCGGQVIYPPSIWPPLLRSHSASNGHLEVCKLLLQAGAKKGPKDVDNNTPADAARREGHIEILAECFGEHTLKSGMKKRRAEPQRETRRSKRLRMQSTEGSVTAETEKKEESDTKQDTPKEKRKKKNIF